MSGLVLAILVAGGFPLVLLGLLLLSWMLELRLIGPAEFPLVPAMPEPVGARAGGSARPAAPAGARAGGSARSAAPAGVPEPALELSPVPK